jgi:hypothetical protein
MLFNSRSYQKNRPIFFKFKSQCGGRAGEAPCKCFNSHDFGANINCNKLSKLNKACFLPPSTPPKPYCDQSPPNTNQFTSHLHPNVPKIVPHTSGRCFILRLCSQSLVECHTTRDEWEHNSHQIPPAPLSHQTLRIKRIICKPSLAFRIDRAQFSQFVIHWLHIDR